jgi:hypothetical protein
MEAENWLLVFGVVLAIGLLAKLGIHLIESSVGRGVFLTILLIILIVVEKAIFDFAIPAGQDEIIRQNYRCTGADYNRPGCPGYPPPWQPTRR